MADTVTTQSSAPATPPAGTVIATDDAGADGQVQIVKLGYSADGVATRIPADANGLGVNTELPAAAALSDSMSNPTTPAVGSFGAVWDQVNSQWVRAASPPSGDSVAPSGIGMSTIMARSGTNLYSRVTGDATNGLDVDVTRVGGTVAVSIAAAADVAGTLTDGRKTVAAAGTAEAIRASLACKWVTVTALLTNTTQVNVGGSGALATLGASTGTPLLAGGSVTIPTSNANLVFVDARTTGEGVSFTVGS